MPSCQLNDPTLSVGFFFFGVDVPVGVAGGAGTVTAVVAALAALPRPAWSTSQRRIV
jgi:hypothetical protein